MNTPTASAGLAGLAATLLLGGCSLVSPTPLWELVKGAGVVTAAAMADEPPQASFTLRQTDDMPASVCIEYNPLAEVEDIVPALQLELRAHKVESRVYELVQRVSTCRYWLRYSAWIDWDTPPLSSAYRAYINRATLLLQAPDGQVLSSSHYIARNTLRTSKWASTRAKLAPVVTALLTGVEERGSTACTPDLVPPQPGIPHELAPCTR